MQAIRLLPAVFLFAGAVIATDQFLYERLSRFSYARDVFTESLALTRARLVNGVAQALSDPVVAQNLEWNNVNTVGQTLQNYLRPGEVSQMEWMDASCNLLIRIPTSAKPLPSGCRAEDVQKPQLRWQVGPDDAPVLTMTQPSLVGGKQIVVTAHVILDQGWISAHPALMALVAKNEFTLFDDSSRGLIWKDGIGASGDALATLRVGGWLGKFMPNLTKYSLSEKRTSLWWVYGILGAVICMVIAQQTVAERKDRETRSRFLLWARRYPEIGPKDALGLLSGREDWDSLLPAVEKRFDRLMEQKQIQQRMMKERQEQQALAAIQREKQMSDLQEQLASMADLASLKEQLQHSTSTFLKKMKDVRELSEDMFDVASEGLARNSKDLNDHVSRWKAGVNDQSHRERGARKFFRSLSETPSLRPGLTKLDDELDVLANLTSSTLDQSLHLAMLSRQALAELESGVQVAGLWLGLSMREHERERTSDWMECLIAAQQLVGAETRYATLSFEKLPQLNSPEEMYPPVARVALVSGLFHLYMALLADVTIEAITLPIVLRQKRFADKGTLILSLPHPAHDVADSAAGRGQGYHMDLAKAILAPMGIRVAFLPPTVAGVPVALTWPLPGKHVDVSPARGRDDSSKESELSMS